MGHLQGEYEPLGTHWIALYLNSDNVTYFDSLNLNTFQKKFIGQKNIMRNI